MNPLRAAYEAVIYPSYPRAAATPNRLAAVALLFGLTPPELETARVLELACSDGGNLIPMAVTSPRAQFLGIDLTAPAIADGQEQIRELNLTNIQLRALDLMEFPEDAGEFDYIIVHGAFSWVPPEVRTRILSIVQRHLAPNGIAFIDYNAQPGAQLRYAFRESMRYHVQRFSEPQQRIDQARSLIKLIIDANPGDSVYRRLADDELKRLLRSQDAALFHDSLSSENTPFYFHQFISAAMEHRLQYLAEADVSAMNDAHLPPHVRERLAGLRKIIDKEQYLDILINRSFRQTLLCHHGVTINRVLDGANLAPLFFSTDATAQSEPDGTVFGTMLGSIKSINPLVHLVMEILIRSTPLRVSAEEITQGAQQRLGGAGGSLEEKIGAVLLHLTMAGVITIHGRRAPFTREIAQRPVASPLARLQAQRNRTIATLDHKVYLPVDALDARLLPLLDGCRTLSEIAASAQIEESDVRERLAKFGAHALLMTSA